ncbi:protein translocase subunit SecF [Clostridium sp. CX1]|uniref:Protein-export membrane protein SecF n=1 Tax=Clostridium tanneri TaxID=3037988 RepID=A0ABU4JP38_9CLOT|nr:MULTISPECIES: protein translocase subunit SecF [unclassified Clostridium]MCT8977172.1 protein translocase subunit SecF [Clostridium sp. CX1]MDW8799916.1 protein translocase subunit SecF [Clostridium sp. A1-XYC3]
MLKIIEKTKIWFTISAIIIVVGLGFMATRGLEYGLDFKGGTVVQFNIGKDFNKADIDAIVKKYDKDFQSNKVNNTFIEIKSANLTSDNISSIEKDVKAKFKESSLTNQENIGAAIGKETRNKAIQAVLLATVAMLIYIGIRFEFKFGMAAILSIVHDIFVMLAVYSIFRIPIDSSFIAAILTVIGYSINDTIVVFDRIRENQKYARRMSVTELANASITQTVARSINTVLTVVITLFAVYAYVPSIRNFSEPLLIGIISGCYSSIFIATPFWVMLKKHGGKKKLQPAK